MGEGFLPLPNDLSNDPLWDKPAWLGAYVRLQRRAGWASRHVYVADELTEIPPGHLVISQRRLAEQLDWSRHEVRKFLEYLSERNLVAFPSNGPSNGPTIMQLTPSWYVDRQQLTQQNSENPPEAHPPRGSRNFHHAKDLEDRPPQSSPSKKHRNSESSPTSKEERKEPKERRKALEGRENSASKGEDEEDEGDAPPREKVSQAYQLLVKVGFLGHSPPGYQEKKQRAKISRMISRVGYEAVVEAIKGGRQVWPYNKTDPREPFDIFEVEENLGLWRAAWRNREQRSGEKGRTKAQARKQRRERKQRLEEQARRREEWKEELDERFEQEPPEFKARIRTKAIEMMPDRDLSQQTKTNILRGITRRLYADEKGLKPPQST